MALVEYPRLLYAGFSHTLLSLQSMTQESCSFTTYICLDEEVYDDSTSKILQVQPPSYTKVPGFAFDLQSLTNDPSSKLTRVDLSRARSFTSRLHIKARSSLDDSQSEAVLSALNREFSFTQGPPGCGKTFLGVALTRVLLVSRQQARQSPILLVCRTNHALDSFMDGLRQANVEELMRVGTASHEELTKSINLKNIAKSSSTPRDEKSVRKRVKREILESYSVLDAWSKGLSTEIRTGFPC